MVKIIRDFEKDYLKEGAYHFKLKGFKRWFLIHNYNKIAGGIKKSNSVLDIGCGDGRILNYLDCNYYGIDRNWFRERGTKLGEFKDL